MRQYFEKLSFLSGNIKEKLYTYLTLLDKERKIRNIVGRIDEDILVSKHIVPWLEISQEINNQKGIDIGSGNGMPGIIISILRSDLELVLLEPRAARSNFLSKLITELRLDNVEVLSARAENIGHEKAYRENYDFATCKAVADFPITLELVMPLLKVGGKYYLDNREGFESELQKSATLLNLLGAELIQNNKNYLIIKKIKSTSSVYPRSWNKIKTLKFKI